MAADPKKGGRERRVANPARECGRDNMVSPCTVEFLDHASLVIATNTRVRAGRATGEDLRSSADGVAEEVNPAHGAADSRSQVNPRRS